MLIKNKLQPWAVTGFTDSEGTFSCYIKHKKDNKITVSFEYKVAQKRHSENILYSLMSYFSVGSVVIDNRKSDTKKYHVTSLYDIIHSIIPHFNSYPCLTSKNLNFKDWALIAKLVKDKEHLNSNEGKEKISEVIKNMNMKRSFEAKYDYCNKSLELDAQGNVHFQLPSEWVQSFLDGEGTFYNYLTSLDSVKENFNTVKCDSSLEVAQNSHDISILLALKTFFNSGYVKPTYNVNNIEECKNSRSVNRFIIRNTEFIIAFLDKYPLMTRKYWDYQDWKKIIELKKSGIHNSEEGLRQMWEIKRSMNSRRER
jgi:LAGLIDADG DNA endonuclease family protein